MTSCCVDLLFQSGFLMLVVGVLAASCLAPGFLGFGQPLAQWPSWQQFERLALHCCDAVVRDEPRHVERAEPCTRRIFARSWLKLAQTAP